MRISDWCSDVCSSDLAAQPDRLPEIRSRLRAGERRQAEAHAPRAGETGAGFERGRRRNPQRRRRGRDRRGRRGRSARGCKRPRGRRRTRRGGQEAGRRGRLTARCRAGFFPCVGRARPYKHLFANRGGKPAPVAKEVEGKLPWGEREAEIDEDDEEEVLEDASELEDDDERDEVVKKPDGEED